MPSLRIEIQRQYVRKYTPSPNILDDTYGRCSGEFEFDAGCAPHDLNGMQQGDRSYAQSFSISLHFFEA